MRRRADQRERQDRPKYLLYRQEATALGVALRDEERKLMITRVPGENYGFDGIRKTYTALVCEPVLADRRSVARCTTQRLMAESGLPRLSRAKGPRTTIPGSGPDTRLVQPSPPTRRDRTHPTGRVRDPAPQVPPHRSNPLHVSSHPLSNPILHRPGQPPEALRAAIGQHGIVRSRRGRVKGL